MPEPTIIRPNVPGTTTWADTNVATNPFALVAPVGGDVGGNAVIDPQTGQRLIYNPQTGSFFQPYSIFGAGMFNYDPVCLDVGDFAICIGDIDPQIMSPLPHLTQGTDKLAASLTQNDPRDPILPGLADAYADLYFLREIARGDRTLTDEQEFYLRQHAAGIAYTRREAVAGAFSPQAPSSDFLWGILGFSDPDTSVQDTAVAGAVSTDATSIVGVYGKWQQAPVLVLPGDSGTTGLDDLFGDWYVDSTGGVVDPFVRSQQRVQRWADGLADREVADYVMKHADRATILRLELANVRIRIRTILETEARQSYLDHSDDIAAFAKIDDPTKLAGALQELSSRIVRGQKLKQLEKAAIAVGNEVVCGKRKIDLQAKVRKLSELPLSKKKEFYEGVEKFVADHGIVALAYSLDQMKYVADDAEKAAGKVEHAPPKLSMAEKIATAGPGGGRAGAMMGSMRTEGTKERNALESYFAGFSSRVNDARALIAKGDVADARKAFKAIVDDKSFGQMQKRLKEALGFEQGYRLGQKIGIIIASAATAALGGEFVGAALLARGAPAWVASLGSLATEAAIFLGSERVLSKVMMGEQIFDPNKGVWGNAIHYTSEWIKTMLMFGFLRVGMKAYKGVVDAVVGSRAAKSVVEGVLAKTEGVLKGLRLNPELAGKLIRSAKLRAFGKLLNHGGAFGAEYATFTAWDYLVQLHETKALPKGFFTSKSMVDRLIFLGCLKMGGAAARPLIQPIYAKVMAGQMRRYAGRIDKYNSDLESLNKELVEYDASGTTDLGKVSSIYKRMHKLLKRRAGLENAILKINPQLAQDAPEFVKSTKQTRNAIKEAAALEKDAEALAIIQSGSYTRRQRGKLMSFLREGASKKVLSYNVKRDGSVDVIFKGQSPIRVKFGRSVVAGKRGETVKAVAKTAAVGGSIALGLILDPTFGLFGIGILGMVMQGKETKPRGSTGDAADVSKTAQPKVRSRVPSRLELSTVGTPAVDARLLLVRELGETTERHGNLEFGVFHHGDGFGLRVKVVEGEAVINGRKIEAGKWKRLNEGDTVVVGDSVYARKNGALRPITVGANTDPVLMLERRTEDGKIEKVPAAGSESFIIQNADGNLTKVGRNADSRLVERKLDTEQQALTLIEASGIDVAPRVIGRPAPNELIITKLPGRTLNLLSRAELKEIPEQAWETLKGDVEQLQKLGVSHCDIHEGNVIYDAQAKKLRLLDFDNAKVGIRSKQDIADVGVMHAAAKHGTPWNQVNRIIIYRQDPVSVDPVSYAARGSAGTTSARMPVAAVSDETPTASVLGRASGSDDTPTAELAPQSGRRETAARLPAIEIPRPTSEEMLMKWLYYTSFVNHHGEGTLRRTIIEEMSNIDVARNPELTELRNSAREFLSVLEDCGRNLQYYDRLGDLQDPAVAEQRYDLLYRDITSQMGHLQRSLAYRKATALNDSWCATFEPAKERVDQIKQIGRDMGEGVKVRIRYRMKDQIVEHYDTDFANIKPQEVLQAVVDVKTPEDAQSFMTRMEERGLIFTEDVPHVSFDSKGRVVTRELKVLLQSGKNAQFKGETVTVKIRINAEAAGRDVTTPEPLTKLVVDRPASDGGPVKLKLVSELDSLFNSYKYVDPDGKVVSELMAKDGHILHARTARGFEHLKLNTRLKALATKGYNTITAVITNEALMSILVKDWNASRGMEESFRLRLLTDSLRAYQPFVRGRKLLGYTEHEVVSVERFEKRDSNGKVKVDWNIVVRSSKNGTESEITDDELPAFMRGD